jgi:hypothetical protein
LAPLRLPSYLGTFAPYLGAFAPLREILGSHGAQKVDRSVNHDSTA